MQTLEQRILGFIRSEGLVGHEETLLVGVSGGPDSVCLLHILDRLKATLGIELHVAHLDHMLRGADSEADAEYVVRLGQSMGIPVTVEQRDVARYREQHRLSLEEAAREVRYDFFARLADSVGASRVALGHNRDDQVETVLMNILRGAGLVGLRGMQAINTWRPVCRRPLLVVRPLLGISRTETREYCHEKDLNPRSDLSNYSMGYTRNRIRGELIPLIHKFNTNFEAALLRTSQTAADGLCMLDEGVARIWDETVVEQPNGLLINAGELLSQPAALQRHLLRRVVSELLGDLADIEHIHIEKMVGALSKRAGRRISLPRGIYLNVGYHTCLVTKADIDTCPLPPLEGEHSLRVPGDTTFSGWRVKVEMAEPDSGAENFTACMDYDSVGSELVVRQRRPGDRFQPLGMSGPKKLQDFMVDVKIPRSWRGRVPLVCSPQGIIWVVGWRIADWAKITKRTKRAACMRFERI